MASASAMTRLFLPPAPSIACCRRCRPERVGSSIYVQRRKRARLRPASVRRARSLSSAAGLATADGIVVDDPGRTSDPTIFAAGDCTRFPGPHGPVRLENWRHALEHGAIAGRNAAGGDIAYNVAPSFWSEQYDMYIQGVGWQVMQSSARVRRTISADATLLFELDGDHLAYAIGIN